MTLHEIVTHLENVVPPQLQESYDNCGLQIGNVQSEIVGILYSLDITEDVVEKALSSKCNLIISHHPFIFGGLKNINIATTSGIIIQKCIQHEIAIYSMHTNFDKSPFGVNAALARAIGLVDTQILIPEDGKLKKLVTFCPKLQAESVRIALFAAGAGNIGNYDSCSFNSEGNGTFKAGYGTNPFVGKQGELHHEPEIRIETVFPVWHQSNIVAALLAHHPYEEVAYDIYPLENNWTHFGLGIVGNLSKPLLVDDFLQKIKDDLKVKSLKYSHFAENTISKVAVCGGSGASFLSQAIASGAQAFITADAKYHDFQAASGRILMLDAGHFETEIFSLSALMSLVSDFLPNFAPQIIYSETNWVNTV